jgi:lipase chaperone LimK
MCCPTGKNGYYSELEVQEALIRSHIRFVQAAKNYYKCHDCEEYHLTSQGEFNALLDDPEVKARIKQEQQEQEWTGKK